MTAATILNVILGLGVIVMVVGHLAWAIITQHRAHLRRAATSAASVPTFHRADRRRAAMSPPEGVERRAREDRRVRAPRPRYKPVIGRA